MHPGVDWISTPSATCLSTGAPSAYGGSIDGTVTDGPYPQAIGGLTLIDVPTREDGLEWAGKVAAACRCPQEVWELGFDPELEAMLRRAPSRQ
jgi:hypothetical protein